MILMVKVGEGSKARGVPVGSESQRVAKREGCRSGAPV